MSESKATVLAQYPGWVQPVRQEAEADAGSSETDELSESRRRSLLPIILVTAAVYVLDAVVDLGSATAVGYVLPVLLTYWAANRKLTLAVGLACSLLTVSGFILSPDASEFWMAFTCCALAALAIWLTVCLFLQHFADGEVVTHVVDQRARTQIALKESKQYTNAIIESAPDAVVTMDRSGAVTSWNPEAECIFGWTRDEAIGRTAAELIVPIRFRPEPGDGLTYLLGAGEGAAVEKRLELTAIRKGGEEFPVECTIVDLPLTCGHQYSAFVRDITDRKRAETDDERYTAELERSNRDLQQFAFIASHDMKEPLRMVASYTELLADEYGEQLDDMAKTYIAYAVDGARRMTQLIEDMLSFSRAGRSEEPFHLVDLNQVVGHVLADLQAVIDDAGADVDVVELPKVRGNHVRLRQLFMNLLGNALKFRSQRKPAIRIRSHAEGGMHEITIADNGIGIQGEYLGKVFRLFQRLHTRDVYPGTGIGLAVCKRIVTHHGGRIWAESTPDQGSTFHFTLMGVNARPDEIEPQEESLCAVV